MPADVSPAHDRPAQQRFSIGLLANIGGGLWSAVMAMAVLPLVASWMGLGAFALVAFFQVLQMILQVFDLGFSTLISRELAARRARGGGATDERSLFASLEVVYLAIGVVLGLAASVAMPVAVSHWTQTGLDAVSLQRSLLLIAVLLAVNWPVTFYYGALQGLGAQVPANGVQMTMTTAAALGGLAALAAVAATPDVWLAWQLAVGLARAVALRTLITRRLLGGPARWSWGQVVAHARFSGGITLGSLPAVALTHIDKLAVSWFGSPSSFSMYYLAATLGTALAIVIAPLYQSLLPRLTTASAGGPAEARAAFVGASRLAAALLAPPSVVLAGLAVPALIAWTGDAVMARTVAPVTAWLALGNLCNGLQHVPYAMQLAWRWTRPAVFIHTAALCLAAPLVVWAAWRGWLAAVAAIVAMAFLFELVVSLALTRRRLDFSRLALVTRAVLPGVAAGALGALAGAASATSASRMAALAQCLVGGVVAVGAVVAMDTTARSYLRGMLGLPQSGLAP